MSVDLAVFSGYQMKLENFPTFLEALIGEEAGQARTDTNRIAKYLKWRDDPNFGAKGNAPNIRLRVYNPGEDEEVITHVFFPTRSIPFENASQLEDRNNADYIKARRETDGDTRELKRWLNFVNENNKGENPVSAGMFEFSVLKDRVKTKLDR